MTEISYTVEPDADGVPTIWRHVKPNGPAPQPVSEVDEDMFRAAAAVLAPSPELVELVAKRLKNEHEWIRGDDGVMCSCGDLLEDFFHDARVILAALRDHATGGGTDA